VTEFIYVLIVQVFSSVNTKNIFVSIVDTFIRGVILCKYYKMEQIELRQRLSVNLKKQRKNRNWSQFELAEKADISEQTVNSIESHRLWPSDKTLVKIAGALKIDIYKLFLPDENSIEIEDEKKEIICNSIRENIRKLVDQTLSEYSDL
jgi:transcriptional regulator with XRE-family HTH domain